MISKIGMGLIILGMQVGILFYFADAVDAVADTAPNSALNSSTEPATAASQAPPLFSPPASSSSSSGPSSEGAPMTAEDIAKLRDPFKKPFSSKAGPIANRSELEQFDVKEFRLVGVTTGPTHVRALLLGPGGKSYMASEHAKIGLRGGVISRITPDAVHVKEKLMNILGQEEVSDMEITMESESKLEPAAMTAGPAVDKIPTFKATGDTKTETK